MKTDPAIKAKLLGKCFDYVDQRIETSREAMKNAQDAANAEEKSSAGDKYETGRAMAQIERDKAAQQLDEAMKLKSALKLINPEAKNNKAGLGSLIITDENCFYIAISIGKVWIDNIEYLVISPNSPIGQALLNLKMNDQFTFNKSITSIREIL